MYTKSGYAEAIKQISGKVVGIAYIFENEKAPGFGHYSVWKADIIAYWLQAIQDLGCMPLLFDVRTFVEKAMNHTLPHVDCLINLNAGSTELSPMALVPSTCSFLGIPCIPCDAMTIVVGENKQLSNVVAVHSKLKIPQIMSNVEDSGIFRPLNFGSSIGVRRNAAIQQGTPGIYQEFIHGFDITTPLVYNPLKGEMDFFPTIAYIPDSGSNEWFFGENEKHTKSSYTRVITTNIDQGYYSAVKSLVESIGVNTFCRIDARVATASSINSEVVHSTPISTDNTYFIEINPMPTIRDYNSFGYSFSQINDHCMCSDMLNVFAGHIAKPTVHSLLLANSMISQLQPRAKEERI